jgi:hypothetical protein
LDNLQQDSFLSDLPLHHFHLNVETQIPLMGFQTCTTLSEQSSCTSIILQNCDDQRVESLPIHLFLVDKSEPKKLAWGCLC